MNEEKIAAIEELNAKRRVLQSRIKRVQKALNKHQKKEAELGPNGIQLNYDELVQVLSKWLQLEEKTSLLVNDEEWKVHEEVFMLWHDTIVKNRAYLKSQGATDETTRPQVLPTSQPPQV